MSSKTKSPYMTVAEAAEYLNVTQHTVHRWARKGPNQKLHKKRVGGWGVRLLRSEVHGLVQDDEDEATA
jgi:excisionase family DNA binding protein